MKRIILISALALNLVSCIATSSYTSSNWNGRIKQNFCVNGNCHSLIGFGTINFVGSQVYIQCQGQMPLSYDYDEYKGYNCYEDEFIDN